MSLDPITAVTDLADTIVKRIWPDASEQQKQELQLLLAQIDVNKTEAQSTNLFVSGWRPFIGWVCGSAFAWQFVIQPAAVACGAVFGYSLTLPAMDFSNLMPVLMGLLGLGAMRTVEKVKNAEGNRS